MDIGVQNELSAEELARRLALTANLAPREEPDDAQAPVSWHSEGYNIGDFIGGDGDEALLQTIQEEELRADGQGDAGALTLDFLHRRNVAAHDLGSMIEETLAAMRHGQQSIGSDWIELGVEEGAGRQNVQLVQRSVPTASPNLFRAGTIAGMQYWTDAPTSLPLSGAALDHANACAMMLQTAAEQVYGIPMTSIQLVSAEIGSGCLGAFSATFRHALFVQIPQTVQHDWLPSVPWARIQIAHQLAHAAAGCRDCDRHFTSIIEQLLSTTQAPNAFIASL